MVQNTRQLKKWRKRNPSVHRRYGEKRGRDEKKLWETLIDKRNEL